MAFDGCFLKIVTDELKPAENAHLDKIYQPSGDELVFVLRKKGFQKRLYINVKPGGARVQFTENKLENPAVPPNFCMLLRKYLSSAILVKINQPSFERLVEFSFSASNEMGDLEIFKLTAEFIGNQSNVIFMNENGRIVDALHRSNPETSKRMLLPGAVYEYPESTSKINPFDVAPEQLLSIEKSGKIADGLLKLCEGFSPLVCREIEFLSANSGIIKAYKTVLDSITGPSPTVIYKQGGEPFEYSYIKICQYGGDFAVKSFDSACDLLDKFYFAKENAARINSAAHDIIKLIKNLYTKAEKRMAVRLSDLKKCEDRETLRIYGELIKANIHNLKTGQKTAVLQNYYDEDLKTVEIPLDESMSPSKNAEKYFKSYKKANLAIHALVSLIEKDREELQYLDSVLDSIGRSTTLSEISEIREELVLAGYIKSPIKKAKRKETAEYKEYESREGYKILVGRNNIQNDFLTTKLASKNDMWFHVKSIPGSHVVVFCNGKELSDETVIKAASLAAFNSKARDSAQVPVDYTPVKFVKKPNGAKPGMVIYTTNKTVFVTPKEE